MSKPHSTVMQLGEMCFGRLILPLLEIMVAILGTPWDLHLLWMKRLTQEESIMYTTTL